MNKLGIKLLYFSFFQLILTIISYNFLYYFARPIHALSILKLVHPLIWAVLCIEIIIALVIMQKETKKD